MADARVIYAGWGRDSWSSGTWSNPAVTLPSADGQVGTVTVSASAPNIAVTGVSALEGVGVVSIEGAASVPATGIDATGNVVA